MTAPRIDTNQTEIVAALRDIGATVTSMAAIGMGFPDLAVGFRGRNYLLEIKGPKGELNDYQRAFHGMWKGRISVVRTADEALKAIGAIT